MTRTETLSRDLPAPRNVRRAMSIAEQKARRSGDWGPWETTELVNGAGGNGWTRDITHAHKNLAFCVLFRPIAHPDVGVHLAIRTVTQSEPGWAELQRIKNELVGESWTAVQVYPRQERVIDEAHMYHLWCYPPDHELGFGLHDLDGGA